MGLKYGLRPHKTWVFSSILPLFVSNKRLQSKIEFQITKYLLGLAAICLPLFCPTNSTLDNRFFGATTPKKEEWSLTDYDNHNGIEKAYNYAMNKYKTYRIIIIREPNGEKLVIDEILRRYIKYDKDYALTAGEVGNLRIATVVKKAEHGVKGYEFEYVDRDKYESLFYDLYAELRAP